MDVFFIILLASPIASAYNILMIHPTPSYSHQLPAMALIEALVNRGHRLFVISTDKVPGLEKNYTWVDLSSYYGELKDEPGKKKVVDNQKQMSKWEMADAFRLFVPLLSKYLKTEPIQTFMQQVKEEQITFDVSLVETFFVPHGVGLSRLLTGLETPIVGVATTNGIYYGEDPLGSILHLSFLPSPLGTYSNQMSLWEKMENWLSHHYLTSKMKEIMEDEARIFFREIEGPGAETLIDGCWSNFSQTLVSSNSLYHYPRMLGPNIAEVGPLHLKSPAKLPQNLQDWLDGAEKSVIYFSLGSNMKSKSLPENVRANFLKYFKELPAGYRVLWKWELDGKIPGQPDNILAQKWLPQQSVLAHSKVKMFITQGGLQSFQETVHYGVPVVAIPWFGDQEANAAKFLKDGIGARIKPQELHSFEKIKSALDAVLFDERYTKNMKKLSAISRDFTAQAIDKAIFWVEHVAEHGHALHLRPSTVDSTYFEYFCLDILSVVLTVFAFCTYLVTQAFKYVLSIVFSSVKPKIKQS